MINNIMKLVLNTKSSPMKNKAIEYSFNKNGLSKQVKDDIFLLLTYFFKNYACLISKPRWIVSPNKIVIQLFFFSPLLLFLGDKFKKIRRGRFTLRFRSKNKYIWKVYKVRKFIVPYDKVVSLAYLLAQILGKEVHFDLVPLRYPYHDAYILAQFISLDAKRNKFYHLIRKLFQRVKIFKKLDDLERANICYQTVPAKLTGMKVRIAGRLATQRLVPKATVKSAYKGSLVKSKDSFLDEASFTSKNKLGAYTVKVWLSHKILN